MMSDLVMVSSSRSGFLIRTVERVIRRIDQDDLPNSRHRPAELLLSSLGLAVVHRVERVKATLGRAAAPPVRYSAPGAALVQRRCYPFATRPDFGVAAYANNLDRMGHNLHFRVRVFVNPRKRTLVERVGMSALCQKQTFCAAVKNVVIRSLRQRSAENRERL
jgi:hypothetical protein